MPNVSLFGDADDLSALSVVGVTLQSLQLNPPGMSHRLSFALTDVQGVTRDTVRAAVVNYVQTVLFGQDAAVQYNPDAKSDWGRYFVTFRSIDLAVPSTKPKKGGNAQPF